MRALPQINRNKRPGQVVITGAFLHNNNGWVCTNRNTHECNFVTQERISMRAICNKRDCTHHLNTAQTLDADVEMSNCIRHTTLSIVLFSVQHVSEMNLSLDSLIYVFQKLGNNVNTSWMRKF